MSDAVKTSARGGGWFREELSALWQQWPDKPLFFTLLAVWGVLFHFLGNSTFGYADTNSLFLWLFNAYNASGSEDGHGKFIPFVVLVLFWLKRGELMAVDKAVWWPALGFVVVALALHILGYVVQQPRLSVVGLFTGVYGMMGLIWGWRFLRASFFPFCLLIFCVPLGSLAESITFPLRILVAKISVALAHGVLGLDVVRDGSRIFDSQHKFNYDVAPACSGIRSLVSLLALTTIYGMVELRTTPNRVLMGAMAVPLAILGNVMRLVTVILVGHAYGQEKGKMIEQDFTFLTFAVALGGIWLLCRYLRKREAKTSAVREARAA